MKGIQPYGDRKNLNKKRDFSPTGSAVAEV